MSCVRLRRIVSSPSPFLSLVGATSSGGIVCDGGAHDGSVGCGELPHRSLVHLLCREDIDTSNSGRGGQRRAAADEYDFGAPPGERFGDGIPHLARRVVRDEPHRVDGFDGCACGNDQPFTSQALFFFGKKVFDECDDVGWFGHASLARKSACQLPFGRFDDPYASAAQNLQIFLRGRMREHVQVHRRGDRYRAAGRKVGRQQQVVGDAVRHLAQRIGRRGGR